MSAPPRVVEATPAFEQWYGGLRDAKARAKIAERIKRLAFGNLGDVKPVGEGVFEMRIDFGPGYRVYYTQRGRIIIMLLLGGDKKSQSSDVRRAQQLARELN